MVPQYDNSVCSMKSCRLIRKKNENATKHEEIHHGVFQQPHLEDLQMWLSQSVEQTQLEFFKVVESDTAQVYCRNQ